MRTFQIRSGSFGLSLVEAETAEEALLSFFADRAKGEMRCLIEKEEDTGVAFAEKDGETFRAVPFVRE